MFNRPHQVFILFLFLNKQPKADGGYYHDQNGNHKPAGIDFTVKKPFRLRQMKNVSLSAFFNLDGALQSKSPLSSLKAVRICEPIAVNATARLHTK